MISSVPVIQDELDAWEIRQYWDRVKTERNLKNYQLKYQHQQEGNKNTPSAAPVKKMLADYAVKRAKVFKYFVVQSRCTYIIFIFYKIRLLS